MITLIESLTGKTWHFMPAGFAALGVKDGENQLATFADFGVGLYTIINDGANDVDVVLWGRVYTVASNSRWDFMAHPDVHSISPIATVAERSFQGDPIEVEPPTEPPVEPEPEPEPEPDPEPPPDGGTDTTEGAGSVATTWTVAATGTTA